MRIILSITLILLSLFVFPLLAYSEEPISSLPRMYQMMGHGWGWYGPKSPGVAALLSLQPMPVDLGNFYIDDWGKGILYTSLELCLFVPGIMLMGDHGMGHSHSSNDSEWTDSERITFYSLLAGYISVKVISAYDAASAAEKLINNERVSIHFNPSDQHVQLLLGVLF
ncbi:hypothetical protein ACFL5H_03155 [Candidatus Latescibacterota bacterium]